jgi:hypothetical protein
VEGVSKTQHKHPAEHFIIVQGCKEKSHQSIFSASYSTTTPPTSKHTQLAKPSQGS